MFKCNWRMLLKLAVFSGVGLLIVVTAYLWIIGWLIRTVITSL